MNVKVVGKENVNYVSKKTGNPVVGTTLYVVFPDRRAVNLEGEKATNIFTKLPCNEIKPGDVANLAYENVPGSKYPELVAIDKVK
jgi:hypothetical protein